MPYYLVHYSLGENGTYVYPDRIADVIWKSITYHYTEHEMVGETDTELEVDDRQVTALTSEEATQLIEKYQSSYPKPTNPMDSLHPGRPAH
jgi:hypothetical protein